jgi:hypothetical protein
MEIAGTKRDLENLRRKLARAYRNLPANAKPIASNLMQILKGWDEHADPERHFRRQYNEFMRRMA